jgi:hypothetical protein
METFYPADGWGWCFVDEVMMDLGENVTPHPKGWKY